MLVEEENLLLVDQLVNQLHVDLLLVDQLVDQLLDQYIVQFIVQLLDQLLVDLHSIIKTSLDIDPNDWQDFVAMKETFFKTKSKSCYRKLY